MQSFKTVQNNDTRRTDRRTILRVGALAGLGLQTSALLRAAEISTLPRRVKSCILLFYYGGPSHHETWDYKADAPVEIRGQFKSIQTNVPGLIVGEHLPRCAKIADKLAIVRSMHHDMRNHNSATVEALCGRTPLRGDLELLGDDELSHPCYGALFEYALRKEGRPLTSVALPHVMYNVVRLPGQNPGFLGTPFAPFQVEADPSAADYRVGALNLPADMSYDRLEHREALLKHLDAAEKSASAMNTYQRRAFELIRSRRVREALAIEREPAALRDQYGRHKLGQSLLLARRMVEADVPFITVYDGVVNGNDVNWDSHANLFDRLANHLLPPADQGFSALITDLEARGLLDTTLVVAMGEFGRTPRINGSGGRDHWPSCYSVVLAGGGIKGGHVYGASDRIGAYPAADAVSPGDLAATLFWAFGIPHEQEIHDQTGRPYLLANGQPIRQLFRNG